MADVKWIKIVTNIFDDEKIRYIETLPNGDETIVIWFRILCLAGKSNSSGLLMMTDRIAYTDDMLSSIFNRDIKSIQLALNTFLKLGMIEMIEDKIYISNWDKHQSLEKLEQKKLYDREYQKKKREGVLLENCNTIVRQSYDNRTTIVEENNDNRSLDIDIELDKEKDKEKDINKDKEKRKKKSVKSNDIDDIISIFNEFSNGNEELKKTLISFMEMRKEKRLPLTTRAVKTLVSKLKKIAKDEDEMIEILNNSILSSWQGIFPLNNKQQKYVKEDFIPEHHLKGYEEPTKVAEIDRSELIRKIKGN